MTASIIDGKLLADHIQTSIQRHVTEQCRHGRRPPGLAVVLIGDDPASHIYVNGKRKACERVGFQSFAYNLPMHTTEVELLTLIDELNESDNVDGILVQLPLPEHIYQNTIIERITPDKDVDGFHPYNMGRLAQGNPALRPCTPYGVIQLLEHYRIPIQGQNAVIIGASNIVGRPMALELLLAKATVTICHSLTRDLEQHIRRADIIVSATGVRHVLDTNWLSQNQVVIDIGMHRLPHLGVCGDVDFLEARKKVAWITPVPGGVGPMTITTLLQNTVMAWENKT